MQLLTSLHVYTIVHGHYDEHHRAESPKNVKCKSEHNFTATPLKGDNIEGLLAYLKMHSGVQIAVVLANSVPIRCLTCYVCTLTEEFSSNINTKGYGGNEAILSWYSSKQQRSSKSMEYSRVLTRDSRLAAHPHLRHEPHYILTMARNVAPHTRAKGILLSPEWPRTLHMWSRHVCFCCLLLSSDK